MYVDIVGIKGSFVYFYWKEIGDFFVWEGIVQDVMVMNLDDMGCVGCISNILFFLMIGWNKNWILGDVISIIINFIFVFVEEMCSYGVDIYFVGGEIVDVGDIVCIIDVGYMVFVWMKCSDLIVNDIQFGDVIVGFVFYGQVIYEKFYNGGMGSNGFISVCYDVFSYCYVFKYLESYDFILFEIVVYVGFKGVMDEVSIGNG